MARVGGGQADGDTMRRLCCSPPPPSALTTMRNRRHPPPPPHRPPARPSAFSPLFDWFPSAQCVAPDLPRAAAGLCGPAASACAALLPPQSPTHTPTHPPTTLPPEIRYYAATPGHQHTVDGGHRCNGSRWRPSPRFKPTHKGLAGGRRAPARAACPNPPSHSAYVPLADSRIEGDGEGSGSPQPPHASYVRPSSRRGLRLSDTPAV